MSRLDHRFEPSTEVRRFEVINGAMGRRRWSSDERARILEETLVPGAVVSVVARRHGLTPQQLFTWRREARKAAEVPTFVPAVITPEIATEPEPVKPPRSQTRRRPIALNRKNALFAGSDGGGEHWATIASLVETCKLNAIDPQAYLADVITRIVAGHPQSQLDDLLPWAYAKLPLRAVA